MIIEDQIAGQIKYIGIAQYLWMENTKNWQGFTSASVAQHYCYHLLNIPLSIQLTADDLHKSEEEIKSLSQKYELTGLNPGRLLSLIEKFKIKIDEKSYGISEVPKINTILKSSGSNKRICAGFYGAFRSYIFGEVNEEKTGGYNVFYIGKEISRTPNNPLIIAAVMDGKNIFIRREASELLIYQKWVKTFEAAAEDPYSRIGDCIRRKTFSFYNINNKEDLINKKEMFLKDMMTNYLYHEMGHASSNSPFFTINEAAIGEGSSVLGGNILSLIKEFLADSMLDNTGPLQNIINLAENVKKEEAHKLFYLYLSDNYFYDTNIYSFFTMTDLVLSVCIKYFGKDGIDFMSLKSELSHANQDGILSCLIREYKNIISWLVEKVEGTEFFVAGKPLDFKNLSLFVKAQHMKADNFISENDLDFQSTYWSNIFKHIDSYAGETSRQIQYFLEVQRMRVSEMLLYKLLGEQNIEKCSDELRDYLVKRLERQILCTNRI